jgi:hypothetical protein
MFRIAICSREKFDDTRGVIRIRTSKNRQHNGRKKRYKRTNNDIQNIAHKTKDRVKTGSELSCSGRVDSSFPDKT